MPKLFQSKFLLKSVQIFLVCLVVLGGGILRSGEYVQAAACPVNTGNCDGSADGSCETDLLTDANNCGHCGIVCNGICENGECKEFLGGLIPCGRISDNCDTAWDERADCNLCHLIIMGKLIIDFLLEMAVVVGALFVTLGGILYIFAAGDKGKMALAKRTISLTLYGFAIVFVSWIIVDTVMIVFGYIDPFDSGGKWHKMNCEVPMRTCSSSPPAATFCGDGVVQKPNSAGFNEECDTDGSSCGSLVCNADCTCKTEPTPGVCGVWFSGANACAPGGSDACQIPFNVTDLCYNGYGLQVCSNWVANGNYPDNAVAFPDAVFATFDGIAVDINTNLKLWNDTDYKNKDGTTLPVLDINGPAIINNLLASGAISTEKCFGLNETETYWTNCGFSSDFMSNWDHGSCKITCIAP